MSNRVSSDSVGWLTSWSLARPDRCNPCTCSSSDGSAARGLPGPASLSSTEVMLASNHPQLRLLEHAGDECIVRLEPFAQFGTREDGGIDVTTELFHERMQCCHDIRVTKIIRYQHQVDIADGRVHAFRHGAKNEGGVDAIGKGCQRLAQRCSQAKRFADDGYKLVVDRTVRIGAITFLLADLFDAQQAAASQTRDFTLHRPTSRTSGLDHLADTHVAPR